MRLPLPRQLAGWLVRTSRRLALPAGLLLGAWVPAQASSLNLCADPAPHSTQQESQLLLFSHAIRETLEASGHQAAIISRAGTSLDWFSIRYTHAGVSLRDSANTPWSVRQLYYACDENKPHLYDQGLAGFIQDNDGRDSAYASIVLLPPEAEQALIARATSNPAALALLSSHYSANAYAYSTQFQNCNQWLAELLASAWGYLPDTLPPREAAQQWLREQHYDPDNVDVKLRILIWAANVIPLLHNSDHPAANLAEDRYAVALPTSIETFVHTLWPEARRIEMCLARGRIVTHEGWERFGKDCTPQAGDTVTDLN